MSALLTLLSWLLLLIVLLNALRKEDFQVWEDKGLCDCCQCGVMACDACSAQLGTCCQGRAEGVSRLTFAPAF